VEFDKDGKQLPFAINGEEWGQFMCELFDEWWREDAFRISIRHFDSILLNLVEGTTNVCTLGRNCCQYLVVEYNGDIYPCDFFVQKQLRLGNIMHDSWEKILSSSTFRRFGAQKAKWNETCDNCDCLDFCSGDCLKHRIFADKSSKNLSWLCGGWRQFIRYTQERFEFLAKDVIRKRAEEEKHMYLKTPRHKQQIKSVGRNQPCPCGSGRKFKKCCGR
jgi:uncharacterized protein